MNQRMAMLNAQLNETNQRVGNVETKLDDTNKSVGYMSAAVHKFNPLLRLIPWD